MNERPWWYDENSIRQRVHAHHSNSIERVAESLRGRVGRQTLQGIIHGQRDKFSEVWLESLEQALAGPDILRTVTVRLSAQDLFAPGVNPWEALLLWIGDGVYRNLQIRLAASERVTLPSPTGAGTLEIARNDTLLDLRLPLREVAWRIAEAIPKDHWDSCFSIFGGVPSKLPGRGMRWGEGIAHVGKILVSGAQAATTPSVNNLVNTVTTANEAITDICQKRLLQTPELSIESLDFRRSFIRLVNTIGPTGAPFRFILMVEDVERCSDENRNDLDQYLRWLRDLDRTIILVGCMPGLHGTAPQSMRTDVRLYARPLDEDLMKDAAAELWRVRRLQPDHRATQKIINVCIGRDKESFFRCLHWLLSRSALIRGKYTDGLLLLLNVHLLEEGVIGNEFLDSDPALDLLSERPWDLSFWKDRVGWEVDERDRELLRRLRILEAADAFGLNRESYLRLANAVLRNWVASLKPAPDSFQDRDALVGFFTADAVTKSLLAWCAKMILHCELPEYQGQTNTDELVRSRWWDVELLLRYPNAPNCEAILQFFYPRMKNRILGDNNAALPNPNNHATGSKGVQR